MSDGDKPLKVIILCSWGATSSSLAQKVEEAAKRRGVSVTAESGGTSDFKRKAADFDVALLEPQVRHLKREMQAVAAEHHIPLEMVDPQAFALMNGDKVLDQVLHLAGEAK